MEKVIKMKKIDHKKELSTFYKQPKNKISIVELPTLQFLMIDGKKDPNNSPEYSDAVGALYAIAYKLKFMIKKSSLEINYSVMPLEGLWWAEDMSQFTLDNRENWLWTMMIMQPDFVTQDMFIDAVEIAKKKKDNPLIDSVRFSTFSEGSCMQIFHQGPYGEGEIETIAKLHQKIEEEGFKKTGKHHEIYFNSPLKTTPENLKTIVRQPITAK